MPLFIFSSKKLSFHSVKDVIIISPDNKKAIKAVNDLMEARAAFKKFIAQGGKAEDFKKTLKLLAFPIPAALFLQRFPGMQVKYVNTYCQGGSYQ